MGKRYCEGCDDNETLVVCLDGEIYGPCGDENCNGGCVSLGYCSCVCHD